MIQIILLLVCVALFFLLGDGSKKRKNGRGKTRTVDEFFNAWGVAFDAIRDNFGSLEEVQQALRNRGLESSDLIVGVDFTQSNEYTGAATFGGRSLHALGWELNPYQQVLRIVARTLRPFDDDHLIPAYGFGDARTKDRAVFSFKHDNAPCQGLEQVEEQYTQLAQHVQLAGPTSFAPLIYHAIDIVRKNENSYHILLIIADGQVTNEKQTMDAIVEASKYPLSIIMVGVGDGPWDMMQTFDDRLPARAFDNFQFVDFEETKRKAEAIGANLEAAVALNALMEIPDQFQIIRKRGMISNTTDMPAMRHKIQVMQPPEGVNPPQCPPIAHAEVMYEAHAHAPSAPAMKAL